MIAGRRPNLPGTVPPTTGYLQLPALRSATGHWPSVPESAVGRHSEPVPAAYQGVKGGRVDEKAAAEFREYVAARQGALFRSAVLLTGHPQDAEDLVQVALTRLAERWHTIRASESPDAYVRKIMYNQQVSRWRRRGRGREYASDVLPEVSEAGDLAADSTLRL